MYRFLMSWPQGTVGRISRHFHYCIAKPSQHELRLSFLQDGYAQRRETQATTDVETARCVFNYKALAIGNGPARTMSLP